MRYYFGTVYVAEKYFYYIKHKVGTFDWLFNKVSEKNSLVKNWTISNYPISKNRCLSIEEFKEHVLSSWGPSQTKVIFLSPF